MVSELESEEDALLVSWGETLELEKTSLEVVHFSVHCAAAAGSDVEEETIASQELILKLVG
jgi:hypothetical protein